MTKAQRTVLLIVSGIVVYVAVFAFGFCVVGPMVLGR